MCRWLWTLKKAHAGKTEHREAELSQLQPSAKPSPLPVSVFQLKTKTKRQFHNTRKCVRLTRQRGSLALSEQATPVCFLLLHRTRRTRGLEQGHRAPDGQHPPSLYPSALPAQVETPSSGQPQGLPGATSSSAAPPTMSPHGQVSVRHRGRSFREAAGIQAASHPQQPQGLPVK